METFGVPNFEMVRARNELETAPPLCAPDWRYVSVVRNEVPSPAK